MPKDIFKEISSLSKLKEIMAANKVGTLLMKRLAPNDNSKNQVYLGSDFEALNLIPNKGIYVDTNQEGSKRDRFKADLDLQWIDFSSQLFKAPNAQLILYPKYPEVRISGFLKGSKNAPSDLMQSRKEGRLLFLGITFDGKIIAHLTGPSNPIQKEIEALEPPEIVGVFSKLTIQKDEFENSRESLLVSLREIHLLNWIDSVRLNSKGTLVPCTATNCGGYTLEARLGIVPNGWSEPDFLGWEIKQHGVTSFNRPHSGSPITLMTPEPTAGVYQEKGVEYFIRRFGYPDKTGRKDRLNFGGIYRHGSPPPSTGLSLILNGFDKDTRKISNPDGGLSLISQKGEEAATWNFANLMKHWNRKHAQAAYIPSLCRKDPHKQYLYGNLIRLGKGTDFLKFLSALADGVIYYDPGIKLENASSSKPKIKRRSQFRIKSSHLNSLYQSFTTVDLLGF